MRFTNNPYEVFMKEKSYFRVIVDGMHLLHASGHAGPKSYRSSWEGPALSFFGAGGAS